MEFVKKSGHFSPEEGKHEAAYYIWEPKEPPKAIVQICHGMCEYIERYENEGFVSKMLESGYVVCGCDNPGHGNTAKNDDELGYFTDYNDAVENLLSLNRIMRKRFRSLPYVLLGHSMGSFIVRKYMTVHPDSVDGVIICGTSGSKVPLKAGLFLTRLIMKLRGQHFRSKMIRNTSFKGYNDRFAAENEAESWLSSDAELRKRYREDKRCSFIFTCKAYEQLFMLLEDISSPEWAEKVPLSLPVLIISGEDDPVGQNGEGPKEVWEKLDERELNLLRLKLYPEGRHEILNDKMKDEVCTDISAFVDEVAEGVVAARLQP